MQRKSRPFGKYRRGLHGELEGDFDGLGGGGGVGVGEAQNEKKGLEVLYEKSKI